MNLALDVINKAGVAGNDDIVLSIVQAIQKGRFFFEVYQNQLVKFLTWEEDLIDGKRYVFFNNCWIDPRFRNKNSLTKLRAHFRTFFKNEIHTYYWHNREKQKMIYRR